MVLFNIHLNFVYHKLMFTSNSMHFRERLNHLPTLVVFPCHAKSHFGLEEGKKLCHRFECLVLAGDFLAVRYDYLSNSENHNINSSS